MDQIGQERALGTNEMTLTGAVSELMGNVFDLEAIVNGVPPMNEKEETKGHDEPLIRSRDRILQATDVIRRVKEKLRLL